MYLFNICTLHLHSIKPLILPSLNKIFGNNENPKGEKISNYILELFKPSKTV